MPKDDQLIFPADPQRQRLLEKKFGDLLTWKKPALVRTIGPFDPTAFDPFDAQRADCAWHLFPPRGAPASTQDATVFKPTILPDRSMRIGNRADGASIAFQGAGR